MDGPHRHSAPARRAEQRSWWRSSTIPGSGFVETCDLVNADGTSVVWASRLVGRSLPERVAGIDLFSRIVEAAAMGGTSVYFLGATQDVVERAAAVLCRRYP